MKKPHPRLTLKKETIRIVEDGALDKVAGGRTTFPSCGGGCESIDCPTDIC
jgi:hypothetical protein